MDVARRIEALRTQHAAKLVADLILHACRGGLTIMLLPLLVNWFAPLGPSTLLLTSGVWLSSQIQSGSTGIGYLGTQAGLAFLLSMIQGQGPPLSPTPGLDRFAGIFAGLSVLLVITMVVSLFRFTPKD